MLHRANVQHVRFIEGKLGHVIDFSVLSVNHKPLHHSFAIIMAECNKLQSFFR
jgi:hypothetical protein